MVNLQYVTYNTIFKNLWWRQKYLRVKMESRLFQDADHYNSGGGTPKSSSISCFQVIPTSPYSHLSPPHLPLPTNAHPTHRVERLLLGPLCTGPTDSGMTHLGEGETGMWLCWGPRGLRGSLFTFPSNYLGGVAGCGMGGPVCPLLLFASGVVAMVLWKFGKLIAKHNLGIYEEIYPVNRGWGFFARAFVSKEGNHFCWPQDTP